MLSDTWERREGMREGWVGRAWEFGAALRRSWPANREPIKASCMGRGDSPILHRLCLGAAQGEDHGLPWAALHPKGAEADSQLHCLQQLLSGMENWMVHSHSCQIHREHFLPQMCVHAHALTPKNLYFQIIAKTKPSVAEQKKKWWKILLAKIGFCWTSRWEKPPM